MRGRFESRKATKGAKCFRSLRFFHALHDPEVLVHITRMAAQCEPLEGMRALRDSVTFPSLSDARK